MSLTAILAPAISLLVFITLTVFIRNESLLTLDHRLLGWFYKIKNPTLDHIFIAITWLGSLWVLLPLYIILMLTVSPYYANMEKLLGIGLWGTVITTYALKYTLGRKRPYSFSTLYELPLDPSYPSAHTAQAVVFWLLIWEIVHVGSSLFFTVVTAILFSIAAAVGLSRMYLQAHFPTDVAAGALMGYLWANTAMLVIILGG